MILQGVKVTGGVRRDITSTNDDLESGHFISASVPVDFRDLYVNLPLAYLANRGLG